MGNSRMSTVAAPLEKRIAELEAEVVGLRTALEHVRVMVTSAPDYAVNQQIMCRHVVEAIDNALAPPAKEKHRFPDNTYKARLNETLEELKVALAEVERLHHVADVTCQHLAARSEDNARLGVEVERLRAALAEYADHCSWDDAALWDGNSVDGWVGRETNGWEIAETALNPPAKNVQEEASK